MPSWSNLLYTEGRRLALGKLYTATRCINGEGNVNKWSCKDWEVFRQFNKDVKLGDLAEVLEKQACLT